MTVPRVLPIVIVGAVASAAVGIAAVVGHLTAARHDVMPAAPGTPELPARLPVALWPSDGTEPIVERGPRGWQRMADALYHRDTVIDGAARARAVAFAMHPRREQDARREIALEAHVLRGVYEPDLIAAAWLHPLRGIDLSELSAFGIGDTALAAVRAAAELDSRDDLTATWRREFGMDVVRPDVSARIVAETAPDRRGSLWAVLLGLAEERVVARHAAIPAAR